MPERDSQGVTKKQRFWLDHLEAWGKTDQSLSQYAASHDLNGRQLYNWKSRLGRLGLLSGSPAEQSGSRSDQRRRRPGRDRSEKPPVRFTEVQLAPGPGPRSSFRIRFPNGVILETGGPDSPLPDRDLVSYLASLP